MPSGEPRDTACAGSDAAREASVNYGPAALPRCQRCGHPVVSRNMGCKNPCPNCGTVYPLGDCSD